MSNFHNRARVATATTGTGTITLGQASTGYASFQEAGVADGERVTYCIEDGNNFEVGNGVYASAGQTLTRPQVLLSKVNGEAAGTSPLSLSGSARVFLTASAEALTDQGPHFSARTYGALGDGSTNDHVAIQAAVDAADASLFIKRVYLPDPAVAYVFNDTVTIPAGVTVFGDNMKGLELSRCKPASGFTAPLFESDDYGNSRVLRIGITGLFIDGSSTTLTAIQVNAQESVFRDLTIKNCFTYGLHLGGISSASDEQALNNQIKDNYFAGTIGSTEFYDGLFIDYFSADNTITGNYIEASKDAGIRSRGYNNKITNNHIYSVAGTGGGAGIGIYTETSADHDISSNYIELTAAEAILMDGGGSDVGTLAGTVHGNVCRNIDTGNTSNGVIEISGSDVSALTVFGNVVRRDAATSYATPYFVYFNGITPTRAKVFGNEWQASLITTAETNVTLPFAVGDLTQTGYTDLTEIAEPGSPGANISRAFAMDVNGVTHRFAKDSTGRNRILTSTVADILEFGALGDGSTDDTLEIVAAITAAGAGGSLYFPPSTFIFSDTNSDGIGLRMLANQRWFGAGRNATILRLAASTTDIDILIDAADFSEDYAIENMQIDGNRPNITPTSDLYNTFYMIQGPRGGKRGTYRNLHLANSWGRVLQTSNEAETEYAEDILVEGVWVTNAGTKAISATRSKRVTIKGCFVEVDPYLAADNPGSVDDTDAAESGSCFECNESQDVVITGNHGVQIGASVKAPGIRLVNENSRVRIFGNTIEGAEYFGFIQNANDVDFFGNVGRDITGDAFIIADADGETGTCRRVRVHHNTVIDPDGAFVVITANKTTPDPEVECYIYENDFVQISGSPTHGIYNNGVISPATGGSCEVYQWGNRFTGTIPNQLAGPAAAQIRPEPDRGWLILAQSFAALSHTGDTAEHTFVSYTLPANRMGANGAFKVTAHWTYTNSGNNKIPRIRFGGSQVAGTTETTTVQRNTQVIVGNRNSLSSQIVSATANTTFTGFGTTSTAATTLAIDTTADRSIVISGQLANSGENITLESYTIELLHGV